MTRVRWIHSLSIVAMLAGLIALSPTVPITLDGTPVPEPTHSAVQVAYGQLPLSFEANRGQTDQQVKFLSRGRGYGLFLTSTEAVLVLEQAQEKPSAVGPQVSAQPEPTRRTEQTNAAVVRMRLEGSNTSPLASGLEPLPGKANYFIGNDPKQWRTNVPTYAKVRYEQVYPGVDLVYYGHQRQLEYDLVVAPGADPEAITMEFDGVDQIDVDAGGDLVLHVSGGDVRLRRPVVYQERDGTRQQIPGDYVLTDKQQVGFQVAAYDASKPLVIDPVLTYSTYLGGSNLEERIGIAADSSGNTYVTGTTYSSDFPTANALQPARRGYTSVFISKLNPSGSTLIYSTYVGGSSVVNWGLGITVDSAGNTYVTGSTNSSDFPMVNPLQPSPAGSEDAFVAMLDPAGSALIYSTYLGGSNNDRGQGIAADSNGSAYVTGWTSSTNFPTVNAVQSALLGGGDAFVAKLSPDGSGLVYSTYLGGNSGNELGSAIAADPAGNACVTGRTSSTNFPAVNALQSALLGGEDAFVAKLSADGSGLVYSTYLGGRANDGGSGIAVDGAGNAYVTGSTGSTDFPTANPFQPESGDTASVYRSVDGGQSWSPSGLKDIVVNVLAIDRSRPSTLYAGTQAKGVFKSTDGGASWTPTSFTYSPVTSLAVDPLNSSTVYVGTYGFGLFRSQDGGATWAHVGCTNPNCSSILALATDPLLPLSLYAGIPYQVAKTMIGGSIWTYGSVYPDWPVAIGVDPSNPSILYAGTTRTTPTGGGVYKSVDAGTTWVRTGRFGLDVPAIAIDPFNTSTVYVGTSRLGKGGVFKSTDGGLTWVAMNAGPDLEVPELAVDPTNPVILYAGTSSQGVFKSSDGGGSWTAINSGLGSLSVTALAIDALDPSILYTGTGGVQGTSDAFVAKVDASGSRLVYSTYLGGGSGDAGSCIAVDSQNNVHLTGTTGSANFPTARPLQPSLNGVSDAFVAKLDPEGATLIYSTFLGGSNGESGSGIAVDAAGNAYVAGATVSTDFPTVNPVQPTNAGSGDAFVAKIGEEEIQGQSSTVPEFAQALCLTPLLDGAMRVGQPPWRCPMKCLDCEPLAGNRPRPR